MQENEPRERTNEKRPGRSTIILVFLLLIGVTNLGAILLLLPRSPGPSSISPQLDKGSKHALISAVESALKDNPPIQSSDMESAIERAVNAGISSALRDFGNANRPGVSVSGFPAGQNAEQKRVLELVSKLEHPGLLKADDSTVAATRKEIANAVNPLPITEREEIASQINRANWILELAYLHTNADSSNTSEDLTNHRVVLASMSESTPADLPMHLTERFEFLQSRNAEKLEERIKSLISPLTEATPENTNEAELLASMLRPGDLSEGTARNLVEASWKQEVVEWTTDRMTALEALGSNQNSRNVLVAAAAVKQQAQALLAEALIEGHAIPEELFKVQELSRKKAVAAEQSSHRAYQAWALREIEDVRDILEEGAADHISDVLDRLRANPLSVDQWETFEKYPEFRTQLLQLIGIKGKEAQETRIFSARIAKKIGEGLETSWFSVKGQDKLSTALLADLLTVNLLPIEEVYLERPVARFYSEAYENAWAALEGDAARLKVAKAVQSIEKRKPEDFKETQ